MTDPGTVAVLDIGKSNIKLSACTALGEVLETLTTQNPVLPGPPWQHHDLASLNPWVMQSLAALSRRHPLARFITSGHGSGGVLVGADPDAHGDGCVLPMVDYEQPVPPGLNAAYIPLAGGFFDRGSAVMMAATHTARQMFWAKRDRPDQFATARWLLGVPQYWAWRLSGVAVSEVSILGAQSHLWNVPHRRWAPIVTAQGWQALLPPFAAAGADLGPIRPALAQHFGLPADLRIHAGVHDSSANFYRYQAAGLTDFCVVSTGTWIVAMADKITLPRLIENRGMTCNADITGAALGGALTMGGREYAAVAGDQPGGALTDTDLLGRLIDQGTMAVPTFGANDGQFPGSAGQGRIAGPPPEGPRQRHALAVLYTALLTVACADTLDPDRRLVLDGSFLRDPVFASLVAALRPGRETLTNSESYGIAAGAALLCAQGRAGSTLHLAPPARLSSLPGLSRYAATWRHLTQGQT
jgi:sugar (pentulose or hexulose) kinase